MGTRKAVGRWWAAVAAVVVVAAVGGLALARLGDRPQTPATTPTPAAAAPAAGPASATVTPSPAAGAPTPTPSPTATAETAPTAAPPAPTPGPPAPAPPPPAPSPTGPSPVPDPAGPAGLPASLQGREWELLPTTDAVVALTFDAGANADAVEPILATLAAERVPATFFLTGAWVERHPEHSARIGAAFPVGNHSYDHPAFTELPEAAVRDQLASAQRAIMAATGRDPRPLFRFPFGDRDARVLATVNAAGYGSIRWTVDTLGWRGTSGGMTADAVIERVLAALRPGQIILMHVGSHPEDGSTLDADALPRLISELRARGYGFATVAEFVGSVATSTPAR